MGSGSARVPPWPAPEPASLRHTGAPDPPPPRIAMRPCTYWPMSVALKMRHRRGRVAKEEFVGVHSDHKSQPTLVLLRKLTVVD